MAHPIGCCIPSFQQCNQESIFESFFFDFEKFLDWFWVIDDESAVQAVMWIYWWASSMGSRRSILATVTQFNVAWESVRACMETMGGWLRWDSYVSIHLFCFDMGCFFNNGCTEYEVCDCEFFRVPSGQRTLKCVRWVAWVKQVGIPLQTMYTTSVSILRFLFFVWHASSVFARSYLSERLSKMLRCTIQMKPNIGSGHGIPWRWCEVI